MLDGTAEKEMDEQIDLVVDFCGLSYDVDTDEAIRWATEFTKEAGDIPQADDPSLEWVSPYNQIYRGFPSTCHTETGELYQKTCVGNGNIVNINDFTGERAPPPCECGAGCDFVGFCKFTLASGEDSYVSCSEIINELNCTDMDLLTDACNCACAKASDDAMVNETTVSKEEARCR
jgi:hypothetical protein